MNTTVNQKIEEALLNFYLEADKSTIEEVLQDEMPNVDDFKKKKNKLLFTIKAKVKKQATENLIERVLNSFETAIQENIEKPIAYLKQLMAENHSVALYHNFDKLSRDDIQEIIKDKNLLDIIEHLENEE